MAARVFFLSLFLATTALAQGTLEVIPLKHRTADQVIPVLRPLLEPGGALTGQYSQLIVRASPGNLEQIRAALAAIDTPLRRLVISVRFEDTSGSSRLGPGFRTQNSAERVDQRIQAVEGGRALIAAGESRPLRQREVIQTPNGPLIRETTVLQAAETGFDVVPRVAGTSVTLEIAPRRERFAPGPSGAIRSEGATSTASGRLGEWFELGGTAISTARETPGTLAQRASERRIWVKVEEIPN